MEGLNEWGLGRYRGNCWAMRELIFVKRHSSLMLRGLEKAWILNHIKGLTNKYFLEHQLCVRHRNILYFSLMFTIASPEMNVGEKRRVRLSLRVFGHFCQGSTDSPRPSQPGENNAFAVSPPLPVLFF